MQRRKFIETSLTGSALLGASTLTAAQEEETLGTPADVTIERRQAGKPHAGKTLAAIQPHCDDVPIFAAGWMPGRKVMRPATCIATCRSTRTSLPTAA